MIGAAVRESIRRAMKTRPGETALQAAIRRGGHFEELAWKLVPQPQNYLAHEVREATRRDVRWRLFPSHYAQWYCYWGFADPVADLLLRLATGANTVLDIGANVGIYALPMSTRCQRVFAFEPSPPTVRRLNEHVALNAIRNVAVESLGVAAEPGMLTLAIDPLDSGKASMRRIAAPRGATTEVSVTTIDDFARKHALSTVNLIKIDVEGLEGSVLRGGRELITRDRPTIVVEYSPQWSSEKDRCEFLWLTNDLGYKAHSIETSGLAPLNLAEQRQRNAVFLP